MTVIDLIIELKKMPQDMEVVLDFTKPGNEFFKLLGINDVSEIETNGIKVVMLTGMNYDENLN